MASLTALKASKATYPKDRKTGRYLLSDGNGLNLQIMPSGTKSWLLRFMLGGKSREMGLGSFGETADCLSLAQARERAAEARALLKQGIDPIDARKRSAEAAKIERALKAARTITFREVAEEYIQTHEAGWKSAKHAAQWSSTLGTYAYPVIGDTPVGSINADHLETVLKPIWQSKNETASRVRGRIEAVLDFAKSKGLRQSDNPARWSEGLKHRLPNISKVRRVSHHPALHWEKLPAFMSDLLKKVGTSANALAFCILTAARSGEVRGANWSEIDLNKKIWTIPASRMKGGREHRVPLSDPALDILSKMKALATDRYSLIFPSTRSRTQLTDMAMSQLIRGMNRVEGADNPPWTSTDDRPIVAHGFRSTFRDWCEEATFTPHAVSEAALAHVVANKVEAAYHRTDHFEKRRVLMDKWAEHCMSEILQ